MVEFMNENLSAVWNTVQCETLQTSICRVLTLSVMLILYRHTYILGSGQSLGKTDQLGRDIVLTQCFWSGK